MPGYCSGGICGSRPRASRYTAWPPGGWMIGTPAADTLSARYSVDRIRYRRYGSSTTSSSPRANGFEVVSREAAIGGKPFGQDQQVPALLGPRIAVHREEAADVRETVLLRRH